MADTDKTKPFWVLLRDGFHAKRAHHAPHSVDNPCDLPDEPGRTIETRCYWMFRYTGKQSCCCSMCKPHAYETPPNKRQRRESRREIREQLADD